VFRLGKSMEAEGRTERPLPERMACAGYASMGYWFYRWDWGESVAIDGLLAAGPLIEAPGMVGFVAGEVARWVRGFDPAATPNPMGPSVALLNLLRSNRLESADPEVAWLLLRKLADHTVESGRRLGAIAPEGDGRMLFVDSLYGIPEFLVRYADAVQDADVRATAIELTLNHCSHLQRSDGLFAHFADLDDRDSPKIPWGRGNGWAILGLARMITALGLERTPAELLERFVRLSDALRATQTAGGDWRNLIDDPHSYPESSTTAMATAALTGAVNSGILTTDYRQVADRSWESIADRIDASGHMHGVSYRPGVNSDRGRYEHTPMFGSYPWGQGPYLLAAAQRIGD